MEAPRAGLSDLTRYIGATSGAPQGNSYKLSTNGIKNPKTSKNQTMIIGTVISSVIVFALFGIVILFARMMFKGPTDKATDAIRGQGREIFAVKLSHIANYDPNKTPTQEQIFDDAKKHGWRLASEKEVRDGHKDGASWCVRSYFDTTKIGNIKAVGYPQQTTAENCGSKGLNYQELNQIVDPNNSKKRIPQLQPFSVYPSCYIAYGVKPPAECVTPSETILPFNGSSWSVRNKDLAMAPVDTNPPESIPGEPFLVEWNAIPPNNWTDGSRPSVAQILTHAKRNKWTIATYGQIEDARKSGMELCVSGVYEYDGVAFKYGGYPMQKETSGCHGPFTSKDTLTKFTTTPQGLNTNDFSKETSQNGYWAFGPKPDPTGVNPEGTVYPFAGTKWSRWNAAVAPAVIPASTNREVFLVFWNYFGSEYNREGKYAPQWLIEQVAAQHAWQVATKSQLIDSFKAGAETCAAGALEKDSQGHIAWFGYPMQKKYTGCDKGLNFGKLDRDASGTKMTSDNKIWINGFWAYGFKPEQNELQIPGSIASFNGGKWKRF